MFQVIFPMEKGTFIYDIEVALPHGWIAEESLVRNQLNLIVEEGGKLIGSISVLTNKILIQVDESEPEGKHFWRKFANKYPELNPFVTFWGVVYPAATAKEGLYNLVVGSNESLATDGDLDMITHYAKFKYAYLVKFYRGNWRPGENVEVVSYTQIKSNGRLGPELYREDFNLVK